MKKRSSIIISSIAACAILTSAFAFNGFAAGDAKAVSQQAESPRVLSVATTNSGSVPQLTKISFDENSAQQVIKSLNLAPASTTSSNCPKTARVQNNQQTTTETADINSIINNLKGNILNGNISDAKNADYSSIQAKIDSLLKSMGVSTTIKTAPGSSCKNRPSTAAPSAAAPSKTTSSKPAASTPSASKPTTPASSVSGDYSAFQKRVVELVNAERAKNGLQPLTMNADLSKVATLKSQDMAKLNYFDHNSPTYGSPFDMMTKFGISYRTAGENIAMGQTSPEQVMQGWMNSPGHRANILRSSFTQIGVGVAKNSNGTIYWTQEFIG